MASDAGLLRELIKRQEHANDLLALIVTLLEAQEATDAKMRGGFGPPPPPLPPPKPDGGT
jgi:hypothetical protein